MNKVHSWMIDNFLDRLRDIFSILVSINIMPQVLSMSWNNPILSMVNLSIDNLFVGLIILFLPIVQKFLAHNGKNMDES